MMLFLVLCLPGPENASLYNGLNSLLKSISNCLLNYAFKLMHTMVHDLSLDFRRNNGKYRIGNKNLMTKLIIYVCDKLLMHGHL